MRAPIAYLRARVATPPPFVPRLSPEDYAGRVFPTGRDGTVTVAQDGTGAVHDAEGRYVTTLPAHTVAQVAATHAETVLTNSLLTTAYRVVM